MSPKSLWCIAEMRGVIEPQFSRGLKKSWTYSDIVMSNSGVVETGTWYTMSRLEPASNNSLIHSLKIQEITRDWKFAYLNSLGLIQYLYSHTNRPVQSQKQARSLKFRI